MMEVGGGRVSHHLGLNRAEEGVKVHGLELGSSCHQSSRRSWLPFRPAQKQELQLAL